MIKTSASLPFASIGSRVVAFLIDSVLGLVWIPALAWGLMGISSDVYSLLVNSVLWLVILLVPLYILSLWYVTFFVSRFGATVGKMAVGIRVVGEDSRNLTYKEAFFREVFAKPVTGASFGMGLFMANKNENKQAWHDEMAGTYVLQGEGGMVRGLLVLALTMILLGYMGIEVVRELVALIQ